MRKKELTAWERLSLARSATRPTALDYIENIFDDFIELHGDRFSKDDVEIQRKILKEILACQTQRVIVKVLE